MHHELPQRLDIEWYRARAKELPREYRAGGQQTRDRVQDSIGQRPELKLADAQHIIALEHGFARWADFRRWIETRAPEAAVGTIGRAPVSTYERRGHELVEQVRSGDADALRRVRFHVPRLAHFAEAENLSCATHGSLSPESMGSQPGATWSSTSKKPFARTRIVLTGNSEKRSSVSAAETSTVSGGCWTRTRARAGHLRGRRQHHAGSHSPAGRLRRAPMHIRASWCV
jgi:hypothetical protein